MCLCSGYLYHHIFIFYAWPLYVQCILVSTETLVFMCLMSGWVSRYTSEYSMKSCLSSWTYSLGRKHKKCKKWARSLKAVVFSREYKLCCGRMSYRKGDISYRKGRIHLLSPVPGTLCVLLAICELMSFYDD